MLQGSTETQLMWSHLETFISCMCLWGCEFIGLSTVAFIKWIDELILKKWICQAKTLRWYKCLTLVLSSGNNGEAPACRFSFTLTFCIASNALWGVLSHVLWKMIENLSGCSEWAEVSFRGTAVWEVLVFPQVFRGFPLSLGCKPASLHRWWTSLFGRCSYTWRLLLPTAMRLSGQNAFQECRGTLYFTLSQNNRSFPARCRPERLIRGCQAPGREQRLQERLASNGGELYKIDEL